MNEIQVFSNDLFGSVRVRIDKNNNPEFNLEDVCMALGYTRKNNVGKEYIRKELVESITEKLEIQGVSASDTKINITRNTDFNVLYITEDSLYDLIFESKVSGARKFRKWVTSEVLPSIRKNGGYVSPEVKEKLESIKTDYYKGKLDNQLDSVLEEVIYTFSRLLDDDCKQYVELINRMTGDRIDKAIMIANKKR